ncbi:MAG: hypothetical protein MI748_18270 [Opitutales bacterium]|nr:hypothetical protein [Opitutales bacterium]
MAELSFSEIIDGVCLKDPRYGKGSYYFIRSALDYTLKSLEKENAEGASRHVSGQELLEGIRKFALEQFGPMAFTVFEHWGIRQSSDFGDIVFNLIEVGILGKNDRDDINDFSEGFDLKEALLKPFEPESGPISSSTTS